MWWLCYQRDGALVGVVIIRADSLIEARISASVAELSRGAMFLEGHRLDGRCASLLKSRDIGRMLSPARAAALIERFERDQPKKPPAPSLRQRALRAQRA